ncbi:flagellar biosynthetic protein FliR [Scopulibacillus darangshiensis]|uniref:Flagellar biosynthetic protein FliR n=1 Tax=Scopulibacillus darangshiensis TaxID=442528 RepID=A0A4R2P8Y5_9BACL|nr:flagellar biosynthetic protein FliR [Scopulibacillus darangshiensis]TCP30315.1 flagellar biosynthetic protein FliR [Scopulibacillus darangshiensis]
MTILDALPIYLLVLVRLASFFVTMPVFAYRTIPGRVKVGLAAILALIVTTAIYHGEPVSLNAMYPLLVIKEAVVGLSIGFVAGLLLYAVQLAGAFIDLQMGFAIANTINPENGVTSPLTGQYLYIFALFFFLGVNGHHMLLNGILYSFNLVPLNGLSIQLTDGDTAHFVVTVFLQMAGIAFQLAMPLIGCLFLVDVALGIVARTVPQVNVFVVGLPLKILVSFILLLIVFPMFFVLFKSIFEDMTEAMVSYMKLLGSP